MDDFNIVYLIDNAQQFWSELEDILHLPSAPTLSRLDSTLKRFISYCATYHEQYLQSTMQLEHACNNLLESELFTFHSERMCDNITDEAQATTDPHVQLILYNICLLRGRQNHNFLRSHKRWQPLIPPLMDHILVDVDPDVQDTYAGSTTGSSGGLPRGIAIPIEAKVRSISVRLLYEVCRVQKFSLQDLRIFQDSFIDYLFDLVEQTRGMRDETFNYSIIKLIVALNEQFMVASLPATSAVKSPRDTPYGENRVLKVLMLRLGSSQTFGENMIFMLNRAGRTPDDLCMQLLVLKILFILFTTKGTSEYFYTNDLCVLVDVFLREVVDLDEDNESLRHTYLRVLHPLLTKTQLKNLPYKRPQIVRALESLVANPNIRDINSTTKRLVDRCLGGEWCVQFRSNSLSASTPNLESRDRTFSPGPASASSSFLSARNATTQQKSLKSSKSAENMKQHPVRSGRDRNSLRKNSSDSQWSLPMVAVAASAGVSAKGKDRSSFDLDPPTQDFVPIFAEFSSSPSTSPHRQFSSDSASFDRSPTSPKRYSTSPPPAKSSGAAGRRSAPPAPPKRRKPPAVPTAAATRTSGGATITTIASTSVSVPSPLSQKYSP